MCNQVAVPGLVMLEEEEVVVAAAAAAAAAAVAVVEEEATASVRRISKRNLRNKRKLTKNLKAWTQTQNLRFKPICNIPPTIYCITSYMDPQTPPLVYYWVGGEGRGFLFFNILIS